LHTQHQTYQYGDISITLVMPKQNQLRKDWQENRLTHFPFWGKCWPAAEALSSFLVKHPHYVQDKKVLELAGGLGLPSLVAAQFAKEVCCSDFLPDPLQYVKASADLNGIHHLSTRIINWQQLPKDLSADVLLLSDINYNPSDFDILNKMIQYFLDEKTLILLSTPQRIMGKAFIEQWITYQRHHEIISSDISLFVLGSD
jgi:predicted nicotinamide N-methyase